MSGKALSGVGGDVARVAGGSPALLFAFGAPGARPASRPLQRPPAPAEAPASARLDAAEGSDAAELRAVIDDVVVGGGGGGGGSRSGGNRGRLATGTMRALKSLSFMTRKATATAALIPKAYLC